MPCPSTEQHDRDLSLRQHALPARALSVAAALSAGCMLLATGCGEPGPSPEVMALGNEVYHRSASCVTCHQEGGLGVGSAFPPLRANPDLSEADPTRLIKIVTHGLVGETEAMGVKYNAPMAGLGSRLTPEEIAAVLTYVRTSWRNTGRPVTVDQVLAVHQDYPGRVQPWTVAELNAQAPAATPPTPAATGHTDANAAGLTAGGTGSANRAGGVPPTPARLDSTSAVQPLSTAAWGKTLYLGAAQCASCHQPDALGIAGAYPPLVNSPWVTGPAERLIKVALHGVGGEMEVDGATYNAEMPGQGALLDDAEMAATLTYVRQSWGNNAASIYPDQVAKIRAAHAGRHDPWPAEELSTLDDRSPLTGLTWRQHTAPVEITNLDDIAIDTAAFEDQGTLEDGFIDAKQVQGMLKRGDEGTNLVVFDAAFEAPAEDQYVFSVESTGVVRIELDGTAVLTQHKYKRKFTKTKSVLVSPGPHTLRVTWGSNPRPRYLEVSMQAPSLDRKYHRLSMKRTQVLTLSDPASLLVPRLGEPIVLRGRFAGQSKRGVGVGTAQRVNWAYDVLRGQVTRMWRGDFVNGAARWHGRNDKYMEPAGDDVRELATRPPVARLESIGSDWPDDAGDDAPREGFIPQGYGLQDTLPVFYARSGPVTLRDAPRPQAAGVGPAQLHRTLDAFAAEADPTLHALFAEGNRIEDQGGGVFLVDGGYQVTLTHAPDARVHLQNGRALLIAPARWTPAPAGPDTWAAQGQAMGLPLSGPGHLAVWNVSYAWLP